MIAAVVLDAFGTIVRIKRPTNPYRQLIREGRRQGVVLGSESIGLVMTTNLPFEEMASFIGIELTLQQRGKMNQALERELASIQAYSDAVEAVSRLRDAGLKLGICSNLAAPYGPVVRGLFPNLDGYAFSFELGVVKPEPSIYRSICSQMDVEPGHVFGGERGRVVMIGDSKRCDQDGPRLVGMMGLHLDRKRQGAINDLRQFVELVIDHIR
ncbi:HAD family hydrolase [Pseudomonas tremae]|uniref:HAD family hydrolase n=1 Tax=Pseudomonas syringae group TaxID=136849 RepID=UPI0001AF6014|nr:MULTISPECIES: HAD family hydrolase [Pseudomonas syringae group]MCQ3018890.1 HAD family hydrolase [Pseudomonas tremae]QGL57422.1 HAD family hydrolase [Pseudomonas coronafaciens pv. oryzae str. 1_6]RMM31844.1 Haloacid dehalogenase-like family hydrolase [Pseudomonas coronafaciens pv. oryzae]